MASIAVIGPEFGGLGRSFGGRDAVSRGFLVAVYVPV